MDQPPSEDPEPPKAPAVAGPPAAEDERVGVIGLARVGQGLGRVVGVLRPQHLEPIRRATVLDELLQGSLRQRDRIVPGRHVDPVQLVLAGRGEL